MSLQLPILPSNVSRNAHLLYDARFNPNTVLVVDPNGELQRLGYLGSALGFSSNILTLGKSDAQRVAEVSFVAQKTLENLGDHLQLAKRAIEQQNPDFNDENVRAAIRRAIYIYPPRPMFPVMKVREEPMYLIDPEDIPQIANWRETSETYYPHKVAFESMEVKYGKVQAPLKVLKARIFLDATELAQRIKDTVTVVRRQEGTSESIESFKLKNDLRVDYLKAISRSHIEDFQHQRMMH